MKTVTIGFIGAGFSARLHAKGLSAVHRTAMVRFGAVTASRPERAAEFAGEYGVARTYPTWQELLGDRDIDAVCLCVPNALHAEIAIAAARAGKHVICEKPLTGAFGPSTLTGTERARDERQRALASVAAIEAAVAESGVQFLYAENWVYAPAMAKAKRLLEVSKGAILDIRAEESHSGSHAPRSRRRETAGGGALIMLGSHAIGAALHLKAHEARLAGDAIRVTAVTADTAPLYDSEAALRAGHDWIVSDWKDVETWANVVMAFSDGSRATVTASFALLGGVRNTFEVYTTNAVYRGNMTPNDSLMVYTPEAAAFGDEELQEKIETRTGWIAAAPDEDWARGYPQEMQDFVAAIVERREPLSGFALARAVIEVIYASYQSAEDGCRIDLPGSR